MKKLAILLLLCVSAVRANTYTTAPYGPIGVTFDVPNGTQFVTGEELFIPQIFYGGGIFNGYLYIADPVDGLIGLGSLLAYPADFFTDPHNLDPNVAWNEKWPFNVRDYFPENVDLAHPIIVTPEPGSGIFTIFGMTMIGLLAMLGWAKRVERLYR